MLILAIALGVCIGVALGALGGGGSILTVPALVYALNQPLHVAVTESLVIVGITSLAAVISHARARRVRWRAGLCLGVLGGIAAWAGTALGRSVQPNVALSAFAILLLVVAVSLVYRTMHVSPAPGRTGISVLGDAVDRPPLNVVPAEVPASAISTLVESPTVFPSRRYIFTLKVATAGIVIGILTGFFGVGGGFIIVPVLVVVLGYSMPVAVATSLLVITLNSAVALVARSSGDALDWSVVLPVTASAVLGALIGKWLAQKTSEKRLTRAFAMLLVAVAIYVGLRTTGILAGQ